MFSVLVLFQDYIPLENQPQEERSPTPTVIELIVKEEPTEEYNVGMFVWEVDLGLRRNGFSSADEFQPPKLHQILSWCDDEEEIATDEIDISFLDPEETIAQPELQTSYEIQQIHDGQTEQERDRVDPNVLDAMEDEEKQRRRHLFENQIEKKQLERKVNLKIMEKGNLPATKHPLNLKSKNIIDLPAKKRIDDLKNLKRQKENSPTQPLETKSQKKSVFERLGTQKQARSNEEIHRWLLEDNRCWRCHEVGHRYPECAEHQQFPFCYHCGYPEVTKATCPNGCYAKSR